MKYPKFLNKNSLIGITAPSAGVGEYTTDYEKSLNNIKKRGYNIIETSDVRSKGIISAPSEKRAKEVTRLFEDNDVDMIMCATGGDLLTDILPYLDLDKIKNNPKWIMGASDPTNLLYLITTKLDIATIYGHNAASFDSKNLYKSQEIALDYIEGKILKQESYELYEKSKDERIENNYNLTEQVNWKSNKDKINIKGRIIGGCIDCLRYLPGTEFDYTKEFIEKYKEDGIIWYFDIFSMSAEDLYLTLFQLKESHWFKYIKGVIVGRVLFPSTHIGMTYEKALQDVFEDIPIIYDADIGHVCPKMTIINGSIANIKYKNNKGIIEQYLK